MHEVYSNGRTSSDLAAKQVHEYGTHANRNGEPRSRQPQQQMRQQQGAQSRAGFEEVVRRGRVGDGGGEIRGASQKIQHKYGSVNKLLEVRCTQLTLNF